jgi:hypothetical protein
MNHLIALSGSGITVVEQNDGWRFCKRHCRHECGMEIFVYIYLLSRHAVHTFGKRCECEAFKVEFEIIGNRNMCVIQGLFNQNYVRTQKLSNAYLLLNSIGGLFDQIRSFLANSIPAMVNQLSSIARFEGCLRWHLCVSTMQRRHN